MGLCRGAGPSGLTNRHGIISCGGMRPHRHSRAIRRRCRQRRHLNMDSLSGAMRRDLISLCISSQGGLAFHDVQRSLEVQVVVLTHMAGSLRDWSVSTETQPAAHLALLSSSASRRTTSSDLSGDRRLSTTTLIILSPSSFRAATAACHLRGPACVPKALAVPIRRLSRSRTFSEAA